MTFKDAVEADIRNVFINFDEFATEHTVNGQKLFAVTDDDLTAERAVKGGSGTDTYGNIGNIFFGSKLFFISATDLGFRPVTGNNIRIDGVLYTVVNVVDSMGIYEVTVQVVVGR